MNGSALDLHRPAGDLWRAIGRTVREELTAIGTTGTPYAIGGGSILAARWKHRHSYDIDLLVAPDAPIGMLARANNPAAFETRLRALGGEPRFYPDERLWIVEFDDGKRILDVLARAPLLEEGTAGPHDRRQAGKHTVERADGTERVPGPARAGREGVAGVRAECVPSRTRQNGIRGRRRRSKSMANRKGGNEPGTRKRR